MKSRNEYEPWEDRETLRWAYHDKGLSSRKVGRLLGCSKGPILRRLDKFDIEKDPGPNKTGPWRDAEVLRREYVDNGRSIEDLAGEWDTSTAVVWNWLDKHGIDTRGTHNDERNPGTVTHNPPEPRCCLECGAEFTPPSGNKSAEYCSRECVAESLREQVELECETCGESFEVRPAREDTAKYCSRDCQNAHEQVTCKECGTTFDALPSRDRKFCSKECGYAYRTGENHPNSKPDVIETCDTCGDDFHRPKWKAEKAERAFCSEDCRAEWVSEFMTGRFTGEDHPLYQGDGKLLYGKGWNESKREQIRERDGYECVACGMTAEEHKAEYGATLHVHHVKPARTFNDAEKRNDPGNLITLCLPCHRRYEGVPVEVVT